MGDCIISELYLGIALFTKTRSREDFLGVTFEVVEEAHSNKGNKKEVLHFVHGLSGIPINLLGNTVARSANFTYSTTYFFFFF